jgi:hypothetical protein
LVILQKKMLNKCRSQSNYDLSELKPRKSLTKSVTLNYFPNRSKSCLFKNSDELVTKIPGINSEHRASYVIYSNFIRNDTFKLDYQDYQSFRSLKKNM